MIITCEKEKKCDNKLRNGKKGDDDMLAVKTTNNKNKTDLSKVMKSIKNTKNKHSKLMKDLAK
ncbi:hypothetical protein AN1V17_14810 [Vallitalea sediminicola]